MCFGDKYAGNLEFNWCNVGLCLWSEIKAKVWLCCVIVWSFSPLLICWLRQELFTSWCPIIYLQQYFKHLCLDIDFWALMDFSSFWLFVFWTFCLLDFSSFGLFNFLSFALFHFSSFRLFDFLSSLFLVLQNSSIGDLVTQSVTH